MKCKWCGTNDNFTVRLTPNTIHYAQRICNNCGKHMEWVKDPNSPRSQGTGKYRIGKRKIEQVCKFHKFEKEFCFFCLRTRDELGENETLTIDHIQELNKGGRDIIENTQILCSACHKLKNWARLYMNWHLKE